jgi:hypothetical protein
MNVVAPSAPLAWTRNTVLSTTSELDDSLFDVLLEEESPRDDELLDNPRLLEELLTPRLVLDDVENASELLDELLVTPSDELEELNPIELLDELLSLSCVLVDILAVELLDTLVRPSDELEDVTPREELDVIPRLDDELNPRLEDDEDVTP